MMQNLSFDSCMHLDDALHQVLMMMMLMLMMMMNIKVINIKL